MHKFNLMNNFNISKETNTAHASCVNIEPTERIVSAAIGGLLLVNGITNKSKARIPSLFAAGILLARGISGYSLLYDTLGKERIPRVAKNINIRTKLLVHKPKDQVYAFWRELENLPLFLSHLKSVEKIDDKYSVWKAKLPGHLTLDWTAEIVKEEPGHLLGWSSIPDSSISNAGKIEFNEANNGASTELDVTISYHPPLGVLGSGVAHLLNPTFEKMVRDDIYNFKIFMETGKLPKE